MIYEWEKDPKEPFTTQGIRVGNDYGYGWINVFDHDEATASDLPTAPTDVEALFRAILQATGCALEVPARPETEDGWKVVKSSE